MREIWVDKKPNRIGWTQGGISGWVPLSSAAGQKLLREKRAQQHLVVGAFAFAASFTVAAIYALAIILIAAHKVVFGA